MNKRRNGNLEIDCGEITRINRREICEKVNKNKMSWKVKKKAEREELIPVLNIVDEWNNQRNRNKWKKMNNKTKRMIKRQQYKNQSIERKLEWGKGNDEVNWVKTSNNKNKNKIY